MQVSGQLRTPAVLPTDAQKIWKKREISWLYWKSIYA
jgi:hypothetical protein